MMAERFLKAGEPFSTLIFCHVIFDEDDKSPESERLKSELVLRVKFTHGHEFSACTKNWRSHLLLGSDDGVPEKFLELSASAASLLTQHPDWHLWWGGTKHEALLDAREASKLWLDVVCVNQDPCFVQLNDYPAAAYLDVFLESALLCTWIADKLEQTEQQADLVYVPDVAVKEGKRSDVLLKTLRAAGVTIYKKGRKNFCSSHDAALLCPTYRNSVHTPQQET